MGAVGGIRADGMDKAILAKWLDVPADPWPPDNFRLLGLAAGDGDAAEFERRAFERMERLRPYQLKYPDEVTEGMNLLAQAMVSLCDGGNRALYESSLGLQPLPPKAGPAKPERPPAKSREEKPAAEPMPLAKRVREVEPETPTKPEPRDPGRLLEALPSDPKRLAARKRIFNRRLVRHLRQFEHLIATPPRKRHAERDARTLQELGRSLQQMGENPFWWALQLQSRGDRLLSIGKILTRHPSLDYLVSTQQKDIGRDLTETLIQLEREYHDDVKAQRAERDARRAKYRSIRAVRTAFRKPERLIVVIGVATMAVAIARWITGH